jgi:predicted amidophosphoribosyltransferase
MKKLLALIKTKGKSKEEIVKEVKMALGNNMNQPSFLFTDCEDCGKELNDMEKQYCREMQSKTNQIVALCSSCLDKNHDGQWPAIPIK